ncbi:MAG: hypothetical protein M1827_004195 [Pycnora praestabilis]|nr:MAG: hypothetical protein M1827_004195 [Pycnora praestabilis]
MVLEDIRRSHTNNVTTFRRSPLAEISGSLGDLGTLLPLLIALTLTKSISLSTTLVFTGLANILTGIYFGIPLPVQPMKAIAAVSISRSFSQEETASAGLFAAGIIAIFSITGALQWFTRIIPIPVVKGIQVGAGLSLVLSAGGSLLQPLGWMSPNWADNILWALSAFILLLLTTNMHRVPYALLTFLLGLIFAIVQVPTHDFPKHRLWSPYTVVPSPHAFRTGALEAGLGQLPLTTLNSIIAVSYLSADLLPSISAPSTTSLGISVAIMNLIGCWFGAMPVCHGSGGLAAQYRFGARSGASIVFLGLIKLILGLFLGESLVGVLQQFPHALLGVMVVAAGLELAKVGESLNHGARDLWETAENAEEHDDEHSKNLREPNEEERRQRWTVMLMTVGGLLAFRNDAVGFAAGMLCHWSFKLPEWWQDRRSRGVSRGGGVRLGGRGFAVRGDDEGLLGRDFDGTRDQTA